MPAGWSEYADAVVEAIGDRRGDLVLVAQSLGGFTAPLVAERVPVELIVLVTAMVPRPGETGDEWWANTGTAEAIARSGTSPRTPSLFVQDVPHDVLAAAGEPRDQSGTPMGQPFALDGWPDVPDAVPALHGRPLLPTCLDARGGPRPPRGRSRRGPRRPLRVPQPARAAGRGHPPCVGRSNLLGSGLIPTGIVPAMADESGETPVDIKPRSRDVTDGPTRAGARAMLRAVGMTDDDWDKPQVAVASSWNEVTPCNLPLDRLAKRSKDGIRAAGGFPIEFTTIAVSDGISMGHEGMRGVAGEPGDHRRLRRSRDARRALRRAGHLRGLRQEPARHAHGRGPGEPALGVPLRRVDPARDGTGVRTSRHRGGVRGRGRPCRRHHRRRRARRHRAKCVPERGQLRRHVHRQHHGVGGRGHRHVAPRLLVAARRRQPPRRLRLRVGRGGGPPARARHPAAADHDQGRVRERHRHRDGARRLHQRRAAPPRHRHRGAASSSPSTTSTRSPHGCRTSPTRSPTASTT